MLLLDRHLHSKSAPSSLCDPNLPSGQGFKEIETCQSKSLEKIQSVASALLFLGEDLRSVSSPGEGDLRKYGELTYRRYQLLASCPISIDFGEDGSPPQELAAYFLDRLTFAANLLLDDRPEELEAMGLNGSSTHFLGAFVSSNYMATKDFDSILAPLPGGAKTHLGNIRDRFCALLERFQTLSSTFSVQSCVNGDNNLRVRSYLKTIWENELQENSELLFPLWWNVEKADHVSSHILLAHVEKAKSRFHVINTFPNDCQDYVRTSKNDFQQNCSVSFQAEKVSRVTKNLFAAFSELTHWESLQGEDPEEEAECAMMDRSMEILSKKCKKSSIGDTPFSKLDLPFGYSCASGVYQALFQSLLAESCRDLDKEMQRLLSEVAKVWTLGLKLYVLKNFQQEVMYLGKEAYRTLRSSLQSQIESIRSGELKGSLLCHFNDAVRGYGEANEDIEFASE